MNGPDGAIDVVVGGGGPVGLVAARAFARSGFRVLVVEPRGADGPRPGDGRRLVLAERARRLLLVLGLWPAVAPEARAVRTVLVRPPRGGRTLRLEARAHGLEALGWTLRYDALVAALRTALADDPGVRVRHGAELVSAREEGEGIVVRLRGTDGDGEERRARLLVAAEGAGAGLEALGWPPRPPHPARDRAWIFPCRDPGLAPGTAVEAFLDGGTATLLAPEGAGAAVTLVLPDTVSWPETADPDAVLARLAPLFGLAPGALVPAGEATGFRVRRGLHPTPALSRRLALGTSFHALHPFAAQGLLLAWRDAHLAARTAGALRLSGRDWSGEEALRAFVRTRLPEHRRIDAFVHRLPPLLERPLPPGLAPLAWRLAGLRPARLLVGYWGMGYGQGRP